VFGNFLALTFRFCPRFIQQAVIFSSVKKAQSKGLKVKGERPMAKGERFKVKGARSKVVSSRVQGKRL
jgi:hypothetical protein